jgi:hypothetical protein
MVQRTALLILTGHWTDNSSNNLHGDYKNRSFVIVANANCSHINIYTYHDPVTPHAYLPPFGTPAHIIRAVIPPTAS